jgi:uncharacterized membrane protein (UPF0127 family)
VRAPRRVVAATSLAAAVGLACGKAPPPAQEEPSAAPETTAPVPTANAKVFLSGSAGEIPVDVEVVSAPAAVERGLMYRQHLPPDSGMLFLMPQRAVQTFWMRNTLIPLDMIFIDTDFKVVGVVENTVPRTDDPRTVGKPSRYVLEVNAGWAKQHGIAAGATARFEGVPGLR